MKKKEENEQEIEAKDQAHELTILKVPTMQLERLSLQRALSGLSFVRSGNSVSATSTSNANRKDEIIETQQRECPIHIRKEKADIHAEMQQQLGQMAESTLRQKSVNNTTREGIKSLQRYL